MIDLIEIKLPSGSILKVNPAPFEDAKNLYQGVLAESKGVKIELGDNVYDMWKNIFCLALSSKEIENLVWKCLERCTINDKRVTKETFEPVAMRGDYIIVQVEVARINVEPFTKSLYAQFGPLIEQVKSLLA